MSKGRKKKRLALPLGLTLIEVMAAIVILGIVLGISVPRLSSQVDVAKEKSEEVNLQLLENAVKQFKLDTGTYPADLNYLLSNPGTGIPGWTGPYIVTIPQSATGKIFDIDQSTGSVIVR